MCFELQGQLRENETEIAELAGRLAKKQAQLDEVPSLKPIGYTLSYLACRLWHWAPE
jgi:hypothetical protein